MAQGIQGKPRDRSTTATGIVRKVDELGRIVLPIELRRTFDIAEKDSVEIFVDGETIILKKYSPGCGIAGCTEVGCGHEFGGMKFCDKHWEGLKELARRELR